MNCPNCSRDRARGSSKCICGYNFEKDAKEIQTLNAKKNRNGGFFAPEKKGIQKGIMGGITMMAIAAVWFIGGYAVGIIFFYPPILFLIGLYAFFKGLVMGNLKGAKEA